MELDYYSVKNCAHEAMMQSGLLMSEDDRRFAGFWTIFKSLVQADFGETSVNNICLVKEESPAGGYFTYTDKL